MMNVFKNRQNRVALLFLLLIAGCASSSISTHEEVGDLSERTGHSVSWFSEEEQEGIRERVQALLVDTLELDSVIQLALLNNRHLQAQFESIGIAHADLSQSGLFENPMLDVHIGYPVEEDHSPDLGLSVSFNLLDVFQRPLKKAVARSVLDEVRLSVAKEVSSLVIDIQQAFFRYQAALQQRELLDQVAEATGAAYEAASLLREAGNIMALDLNNERAFYEQTQLEVAYAELAVMEARERVNRLLGLWGKEARQWNIRSRLPEIQDTPTDLEEAEKVAIEASFDLALVEQKLITFAHQRDVVNATALVPHFKLGVDAVREGEWEVGPAIGFPIPLFDRGQAQKAGIEAEIKQQQASYYGLAVDVRAATRSLRQQLVTAHQVARHYHGVIVPLSSQISVETQEQYNAMQIGVFRLLAARQQEIQAGREYIDALLAYWLARSEYEALMKGLMRNSERPSLSRSSNTSIVSRSPDDH